MSLIVEIKINTLLIGRAVARNQSSLADVSDYLVSANMPKSAFNPNFGLDNLPIKGYNRNQPAWRLVEKMMQVIYPTPAWERFLEVRLELIREFRSIGKSVEEISQTLSCDPNHVARLMVSNRID